MAGQKHPLPEKMLVEFAREVFIPLQKGQCVTTLWVAGGGKRFRTQYLLSQEHLLKGIFLDRFADTLFISIHPEELEEFSNIGYLELILARIREEMAKHHIPSYQPKSIGVLKTIHEYLHHLISMHKEIIFIVNNFELLLALEKTIFLNLESILAVNKQKIRFLLLAHSNVVEETVLHLMGNFKYAVLRNIIYVPLLTDQASDYLISDYESLYSLSLSPKVKSLLKQYFGGHPQLLKYSLGKIANSAKKTADVTQLKQDLESDYELRIAAREIWKSLNQKEQDIVYHVVQTGDLPQVHPEDMQYIVNTGLISKIDGRAKTFGQFFDQIVSSEKPHQSLSYKEENGEVYFGPLSCLDQFTPQEYGVLNFLVKNQNSVVSRDQIAEVLWNKESHEKYSDWAIDKVISVVRKKLQSMGFPPQKLQTLKKRGFKLSS